MKKRTLAEKLSAAKVKIVVLKTEAKTNRARINKLEMQVVKFLVKT